LDPSLLYCQCCHRVFARTFFVATHVLEKNLRALRGLRYPETQTQMRSFLGMCGVYRRFVADFAMIAKPLTAFTSTKLPKEATSPSGEGVKGFRRTTGTAFSRPHSRSPQVRRGLHR